MKGLVLALSLLATTAAAQTPFTMAIWNTDPQLPGAIVVRVDGGDPMALYEVQSSPDGKVWSDEARMPAGAPWFMEFYPRHERLLYRAKLLGF